MLKLSYFSALQPAQSDQNTILVGKFIKTVIKAGLTIFFNQNILLIYKFLLLYFS